MLEALKHVCSRKGRSAAQRQPGGKQSLQFDQLHSDSGRVADAESQPARWAADGYEPAAISTRNRPMVAAVVRFF